MSSTPTETSPPTRGPDAVRARLMDAAAALLEDAPPTDVTSRQIADAAGVNQGQIHHYFGSKDELVAATVAHGAAQYQREQLADGTLFPIPIDTSGRRPGWRTLAYLASTGAWRQPPFKPSPVVAALAEQRAADLGSVPTDPIVMADVAAAIALQRGWWIFRDIIETALGAFSPDIPAIRLEVAARSAHLLDDSRSGATPTIEPPPTPAVPTANDDAPRGRDEVRASLITAAFALLSERPPSQVTTKEIAAAAGVNHGQVHHYFESKEHLVAQTVRFGSATMLQTMHDRVVPIRTEERLPMWRTLAHIAATEDWVGEAYDRSPVVMHMVEVIAERTGEPTSSASVHAQVAAVHALDLGWAIYRNIIEYGLEALGGDLVAMRSRLATISTRLVDEAAQS